jgi:hypothetical protein
VEDLTRLPKENQRSPIQDSLEEKVCKTRSFFSSHQKLPLNWKRKHSPDGQVYYYNTITNATTYNLADVKQSSVTKRRSLLLGDNGVVSVSGSEGIPFSFIWCRKTVTDFPSSSSSHLDSWT